MQPTRKIDPSVPEDLVHLARLSMTGRNQDVEAYVQLLVRRYRKSMPDTADALRDLLRSGVTAATPLRSVDAPAPVDVDSRMALLRPDLSLEVETPILRPETSAALEQLRDERLAVSRLEQAGLLPSRTALFTGPPGVGKTMSARWLANELRLPLLVLDLSSVMSSMLGKTGANLRRVLDYAKQQPSVLLLDELDAVAKRRNDATEVGELKRLVTVLIQELDDWPSSSLLLAATNHAELLDPAIWRRFDLSINFELPGKDEIASSIVHFSRPVKLSPWMEKALAVVMAGSSFSDVERALTALRRRAAVRDTSLDSEVLPYIADRVQSMMPDDRRQIAVLLSSHPDISQRRASELTGVSRDTIRGYLKNVKKVEG